MPSRRTFLALTASLLGLPLAAAPAAALSGPGFGGFGDGPGALALGPRPAVRRYGRHFLVNGWVLTAEDLERLGLHAA